jgi:hypothetical protein
MGHIDNLITFFWKARAKLDHGWIYLGAFLSLSSQPSLIKKTEIKQQSIATKRIFYTGGRNHENFCCHFTISAIVMALVAANHSNKRERAKGSTSARQQLLHLFS